MAFTVHPVGANSGFSEESELDSELHRLLHSFGDRMATFVVSPFTNNHFNLTNPTGTDAQIAAGDAMVGGHLVRMDSAVTKTLNTSVTSEIFLVVDDAKSNNAAIVAQDKATTDPSGQYVVKLWEATTDSTTITGTTDFRPYVPFRDNADDAGAITGKKTGTVQLSIDATGVVTKTVSFAEPYRTALDDVQLTMEDIGDTGAEMAYQRVPSTSKSTTGFDVEIRVATAGASGTTVTYRWTANGK